MWSVKNEAEPFESAAVVAAQEQMLTVCNVPQHQQSPCWALRQHGAIGPALLGGAGSQLLQVLQNEGTQNS